MIRDFEAILSYEKIDQIVEFKLNINKKIIVVKEKSDDVFKSIDLAIDNLERQVVKVKDQAKNRRKQKPAEILEV
jgi:putative sigma-54 modulation protein